MRAKNMLVILLLLMIAHGNGGSWPKDPPNSEKLAEIEGKARLFGIKKIENTKSSNSKETKKWELVINQNLSHDDETTKMLMKLKCSMEEASVSSYYSSILQEIIGNDKVGPGGKSRYGYVHEGDLERYNFFFNENRGFTDTLFSELSQSEKFASYYVLVSIYGKAVEEDLPKTCKTISPTKVEDNWHFQWYFRHAVTDNAKNCVKSILKNTTDFDEMKSVQFYSSNYKVSPQRHQPDDINALQFVVTDYGNKNDWGEMCEILLQNDGMKDLINVHYSDWEMNGTPLIMAAHFNHGEHVASIVECLLRHGANIEATDRKGRTALRHAVTQGNEKACKILLENHADTKGTIPTTDGLQSFKHEQTLIGDAIKTAIEFPNAGLGCLPALLKYADVNQVLIPSQNQGHTNGTTHLHLASKYHNGDICRLLLEPKHGANTDELGLGDLLQYNAIPITPLMHAIMQGNQGCVEEILRAGPKLEAKSGFRHRYAGPEYAKFQGKTVEYFAENSDWNGKKPQKSWRMIVKENYNGWRQSKGLSKIVRYVKGKRGKNKDPHALNFNI